MGGAGSLVEEWMGATGATGADLPEEQSSGSQILPAKFLFLICSVPRCT